MISEILHLWNKHIQAISVILICEESMFVDNQNFTSLWGQKFVYS